MSIDDDDVVVVRKIREALVKPVFVKRWHLVALGLASFILGLAF